jgi:hypothetical protein
MAMPRLLAQAQGEASAAGGISVLIAPGRRERRVERVDAARGRRPCARVEPPSSAELKAQQTPARPWQLAQTVLIELRFD